jgi:hypothetical protein
MKQENKPGQDPKLLIGAGAFGLETGLASGGGLA